MDRFHLHIILNPASAGGKTGTRQGKILREIEKSFGRSYSLFITNRPLQASQSTAEAIARGCNLVIAVGGDGTIHEVVNGFFANGHPINPDCQLGVISSGTGNGFAQSLALPRSLRGQVEVTHSGRSRRVDVGRFSLRGSPQDHFLDKTSAVVSAELRLPIVWRFGGVAGFDLGKVWDAPETFDLHRWASNPVAGPRFYMDTFVARLDVGFGQEATGFYLNFGHLF